MPGYYRCSNGLDASKVGRVSLDAWVAWMSTYLGTSGNCFGFGHCYRKLGWYVYENLDTLLFCFRPVRSHIKNVGQELHE